MGVSAGAHLSMLYGYKVDKSNVSKKNIPWLTYKGLRFFDNSLKTYLQWQEIKAICNYVGPADLNDPSNYANPISQQLVMNLVGNNTLKSNPAIYNETSPVTYITNQSPKTISFYGGQDPLVLGAKQGTILRDKLNGAGVYNEDFFYSDDGHGFTNSENGAHALAKLKAFFQKYL